MRRLHEKRRDEGREPDPCANGAGVLKILVVPCEGVFAELPPPKDEVKADDDKWQCEPPLKGHTTKANLSKRRLHHWHASKSSLCPTASEQREPRTKNGPRLLNHPS